MKKSRTKEKIKKLTVLTVALCMVMLGVGAYLLIESPKLLADKTSEQPSVASSTKPGETNTENPNTAANSQTETVTPPQKTIYGEMQTENSWAFDVRVPENILQDGSFAVKLRVLSVGEAKFMGDDPVLYYQPSTPYQVELLGIVDTGASDRSALRGLDKKSQATVYVSGGLVSVKDVLEYVGPERGEKLGVSDNTFTEQEKESNYIAYTSDYDYTMNPGEEYVVLLKADTDGTYYVSCRGYGIFKSDTPKSSALKSGTLKSGISDFKNVITGTEYQIDDSKLD